MKRLQINTLEKGWEEWDTLLLHACFQILVNYWEKEAIPDGREEDSSDCYLTLKGLYDWWIIKRPKDQEELENILKEDNKTTYMCSNKTIEKFFKRERELEKIDQANLHKLIECRGYMWK